MGISQYREQMSSVVGFLAADFLLFPFETVLHRLHLQGTRTIIDNLDTGKEVVPIITRYEGFVDCFYSIITEEGFSGLFKGFGALMLQYAIQIAILRFSFLSIKEVLKIVNYQSELPPMPKEYLEMHTPEIRHSDSRTESTIRTAPNDLMRSVETRSSPQSPNFQRRTTANE